MKIKHILVIAWVLVFFAACGGYKYKAVPIRDPKAMANHKIVAGAYIAAISYSDPEEAEEAFGFDIIGAGLLPVQVIVDNRGKHPIKLIPEQIFLKDSENNFWRILPAKRAYQRINEKVRLARMGEEGARSGVLTGAAGAIIGFAIGVVTGQDVGELTIKGAVTGAALGSVTGGSAGYHDVQAKQQIAQDLRDRGLKDKAFAPKDLSHGFLFFPGESKEPKSLRLRIQETDSGKIHNLDFIL